MLTGLAGTSCKIGLTCLFLSNITFHQHLTHWQYVDNVGSSVYSRVRGTEITVDIFYIKLHTTGHYITTVHYIKLHYITRHCKIKIHYIMTVQYITKVQYITWPCHVWGHARLRGERCGCVGGVVRSEYQQWVYLVCDCLYIWCVLEAAGPAWLPARLCLSWPCNVHTESGERPPAHLHILRPDTQRLNVPSEPDQCWEHKCESELNTCWDEAGNCWTPLSILYDGLAAWSC